MCSVTPSELNTRQKGAGSAPRRRTLATDGGSQGASIAGGRIKRVEVTDAQGRRWTVAIRWLPWSLRWRGPKIGRSRKKADPSIDPDLLDPRTDRQKGKATAVIGILDWLDVFGLFGEGCAPVFGVVAFI